MTDGLFEGEEAVLHVIERIVAPLGLRVDESSPWVDARLSDGSRVQTNILRTPFPDPDGRPVMAGHVSVVQGLRERAASVPGRSSARSPQRLRRHAGAGTLCQATFLNTGARRAV
jgi:hypothetical protein